MLTIPLSPIPNQNFIIQLDNHSFDITINACNNIMAITIYVDNQLILSGERLVPQTPIIPYSYLEHGNFIFLTANNEYPDYKQFDNTQNLIYLTQQELELIRNG